MTASKSKKPSGRVSNDAPSTADDISSPRGPAPPSRHRMRNRRHAVSKKVSLMTQNGTLGSGSSLHTTGQAVELSRGSGDEQADVFGTSSDEMLAKGF